MLRAVSALSTGMVRNRSGVGILVVMSKRVQENAKAWRDAALERERRARRRAQDSRERGDNRAAQIHEHSAGLQADAASKQHTVLKADQEIEGDRLEDQPAAETGAHHRHQRVRAV